jgi:hypothetical protein
VGVFPDDVGRQERELSAAMYQGYSSNMLGDGAPEIAWRVTPNPMHEEVGILAVSREVGAIAPEWIDVVDLLGRRVVRLNSRGESGYTWDGRDASGRLVSAGLYFGRGPGTRASARILVVR